MTDNKGNNMSRQGEKSFVQKQNPQTKIETSETKVTPNWIVR